MAASAQSLPAVPHSNPSPWLISRNQDSIWLLGGAIFGYLTLLAVFSGAPVLPFSLLMLFVLESPHVFATTTRSYLDPEERRRLGPFLLLVVPLCLFGAGMVWLGYGVTFYVVAVLWLHFHIAKQHVGFVMLYKRKAGEGTDIKLDKYFILGSLTIPVVLYLLRDLLSRGAIALAVFVYLSVALWYVSRQYARRHSLVPQKLLLMSLVIPLQWLAFWYAGTHSEDGGIRVAGIVITFCHSMQYHRLMRLYHTTEHALQPESRKAWHTLGGYLFVIFSLNAIFFLLPRFAAGGEIIAAGLWGFSFMHYLIDGKIWKTKDYPVFRRALGV